MYVDIPELQRCCCCIPARYGLLLWMYLKFVLSTLMLTPIIILLWIFGSNNMISRDIELIIIIVLTIFILVLDIFMNIVAIIGGHKKNVKLLRVYYKYSIFALIMFITIMAIIISSEVYKISFFDAYYALHYALWYVVVGLASIVLQGYMLLLLRSKVHKLRNNCKFRFVNNAAEVEAECAIDIDNFPDSPNYPIDPLSPNSQ